MQKIRSETSLLVGFVILCVVIQPSFSASEIKGTLETPFDLRIGDFAEFSKFKITFVNVTSDSRCPADVICIWQGEVSILLNMIKDGKSSDYVLTLGENENHAIKTFDGYFVKLTKVEPYPFSSNQTKPSDYVATLFVSTIEDIEPVKSPLKQSKAGALNNEIKCKENLSLVIKLSDSSPACVTQKTAQKLILRGWAQDMLSINNFKECVAAGNPVMESYPRQCRTSDGKNFVEKIDSKMMSSESLCTQFGGNWLAEFNECEFISAEQCSTMNGVFSECESACRNMPDAQVCTTQCVPVCTAP